MNSNLESILSRFFQLVNFFSQCLDQSLLCDTFFLKFIIKSFVIGSGSALVFRLGLPATTVCGDDLPRREIQPAEDDFTQTFYYVFLANKKDFCYDYA